MTLIVISLHKKFMGLNEINENGDRVETRDFTIIRDLIHFYASSIVDVGRENII